MTVGGGRTAQVARRRLRAMEECRRPYHMRNITQDYGEWAHNLFQLSRSTEVFQQNSEFSQWVVSVCCSLERNTSLTENS